MPRKHRDAANGADRPEAAAAGDPGKKTHAERLPGHGAAVHHEMTDVPLVALGLYCERPEAADDTEGCFLATDRGRLLLQSVGLSAVGFTARIFAAIRAVRDEIRGNHIPWGLTQEMVFMCVSTATASLLGLTATMAVVAARIEKTAAMLGKGVRSEIMHGGSTAPSSDEGFLTYLDDRAGALPNVIIQSVAASSLDHREMLALYHALNDPAIVSQAVLQRQIHQQLQLFQINRVARVGDRVFGDRELAAPVLVRDHRQTYMTLCEAFGLRHLAAELNGANTGNTEEPITMESLHFVRIVEPSMHDLMLAAWRQRRPHEPVPHVNLDTRDGRDHVRWEHTFRAELEHHPDPLSLVYQHRDDGDGDVVATAAQS
jgi:hypothetical protein